MAIEVRPAEVFDDVREVIGPKRPDANGCWCLFWCDSTCAERCGCC